jgi:hypothetical protein
MFLPIAVAIFLGAWGLPPSLHPRPAQGVEKQKQPTQQEASAEPSVNEQKTKSDQRTGEKEHEQKHKENLIERIVKFVREYNAEIVTISTAIMALFTIGLFFSTHLLWKSGEKHSERELRAYVVISKASIEHVGNMQPVIAELYIKNTG